MIRQGRGCELHLKR
jgi:hypothetical protein